MKTIIQTMLEEIYFRALEVSRNNSQTVGEKKDYYITLEQLESIITLEQLESIIKSFQG